MPEARFLRLSDVAEILDVSMNQTYALVRSGDLRAIQVGGRNQWRVERSELELYIQRAYDRTASSLRDPSASSLRDPSASSLPDPGADGEPAGDD